MNLIKKIQGVSFRKSSYSRIRRCVGVAINTKDICITNTNKNQPILTFSHNEWDCFVKGVKEGEFDAYSSKYQLGGK